MRTVIERMPRMAAEPCPLDEAVGRVLAAPIVATRPLPGFDNSAMDGYAARAAELPATLPVAFVVAAGDAQPAEIPAGACVRIYTGAPLPAALDTVVMQENVTVGDDGRVTLPAQRIGDNVRRAGEDIAVGETIFTAGTRLVPWQIGALAALGVAQVPVARKPRIAILATGDELVTVDVTPGPGQLVNSSAYALAALVREAGGEPVPLGIAPDEVEATTRMLEQALASDAVITTGGVSVGDRDYVHAALAAAGVTLELYKVAMKPGKPFSFGVRPGSPVVPVFGLPGNPVSTLVAYELFLRPAILAMQGAAVPLRARATVQLPAGFRKDAGRTQFVRAHVTREGENLVARTHAKQGSAMLSSIIFCNALVEIPADATMLLPGATASAILLEAV